MSATTKVVTRAELYGLVWTRSFVRLARELGFTYPELILLCNDLNIPRPSGGYWYRLKHGVAEDPVPLPPRTTGMRNEIGTNPGRWQAETLLIEPEQSDKATEPQGSAQPEAKDEQPAILAVSEVEAAPSVTPTGSGANEPAVSKLKREAQQRPADVEFTRQQLHEAIWSKPCLKLAAELGISDVALAKTCRRMGVPRPPRGYWARVEAGEKMRREPLPVAKSEQSFQVTFDVAANLARRGEWAVNNILTGPRMVKCLTVELPPEGSELHPIVEKHRQALEKAKPGELGFVSAKGKDLFTCEMSAVMVPRLVRALQALVCELEDRDYEFKPGSSGYEGLQIVRDDDQVTLRWGEDKVEVEREPTPQEKRKPSWTWQLKETKPTGTLSVEISALGLKGKRRWAEGEGRSLEQMLGVVVDKIEAVFQGYEERRKREVEWANQREEQAKRAAEQEAIEAEKEARAEKARKERERINCHQAKLEKIAEQRCDNLARAAQEWIEMQGMLAFIQACEDQWRREVGGTLSKEQTDWLFWAREAAAKMGPRGYPNPSQDGNFDASAVPVGGPYPETRKWEANETREKPPPEIKPQAYEPPMPSPEPFPFWLMHRHH